MYAAAVVDVEVDRNNGVIRCPVVMAADLGLVVNRKCARTSSKADRPGGQSHAQGAGRLRPTPDHEPGLVGVSRPHIPEVPSIDIVLMQRSDPSLGAGEGSLAADLGLPLPTLSRMRPVGVYANCQ